MLRDAARVADTRIVRKPYIAAIWTSAACDPKRDAFSGSREHSRGTERAIRQRRMTRSAPRESIRSDTIREEGMFERDRDTPRREDEREVDVQDEDRGSTSGTRRTGSKSTGSRSQTHSGSRSGSSSQKKK